MSFFLRQLWRQKPQAYGPVSAVQRNIFLNAERCGIDPGSIALYLPMWGPGDQVDYIGNGLFVNEGAAFTNNSLRFDGAQDYLHRSFVRGSITLPFTVFCSCEVFTVSF